jgi:uncharacterized protein
MTAYGNGDGVEQNPEKAFAFALKCAENNDATCRWNVVKCYYQGMGVQQDLDKMLTWATRLGNLENPENLSRTKYMYTSKITGGDIVFNTCFLVRGTKQWVSLTKGDF